MSYHWPKAVLASFFIALALHSEGSVTVIFTEVGGDVIATTSGSMVAPQVTTFTGGGVFEAGVDTLYHIPGGAFANEGWDGTASAPTILSNPSSASGDTFGFKENVLYFDELIFEDDVFSPSTTWIWENNTLAGIGLSTLLSGPVVAYTTGDGETIYYAKDVPEPSSALLGMIGTVGLLIRRRR